MITYKAWSQVPENLKTRTQLGRLGLRLAPGQKPVACFYSSYYKRQYELFDVSQCLPKRLCSEKALAHLALARKKACTCSYCGRVFSSPLKYCDSCKHWFDHCQPIVEFSAQLLQTGKVVFFDTETTGLDSTGQLVELAVVDSSGCVLLDTLLKPTCLIPPEATAVHGITDAMVETAPNFRQIVRELVLIMRYHSAVAYNLEFDMRMLKQTAFHYGMRFFPRGLPLRRRTYCAMEWFAEWYGDWSDYHGYYRWYSLSEALSCFGVDRQGKAHRALSDAFAVRALVQAFSEQRREKCQS